MEFLYFIFGVFLLVLLFRIFFRYVFPWILLRWVKKRQREFQDTYQEKKKEGEMNINYDPQDNKTHIDGKLGEYVDFEDLPEDNN